VTTILDEIVAAGVDVTVRFSSLVAATGLELLDCWEKLSSVASPTPQSPSHASRSVELLSQIFPLLLTCFASDDMPTSQATLPFLHAYITRLRKLLPAPKEVAAHEGHLRNLLLVMGRKSLHPDDFDFEFPDESETNFGAYRRELSTLFKGVARVHASLAQEFVRSTLLSTLEMMENVPWAHIEAALWLVYTLGEGLSETLVREKGGVFHGLMTSLLSSSASAYPHRAVQLLVLEINVRYYRFYLANPGYLAVALSGFLDTRGICNTIDAVRARACYLLLRFVKLTLKVVQDVVPMGYSDVFATLLDLLKRQWQVASAYELPNCLYAVEGHATPPLVASDGASSAAHHALAVDRGGDGYPQFSTQEQLNLYEACGQVLGSGITGSDEVAEQLRELLERPVLRIQELARHADAGNPTGVVRVDSTFLRQLEVTRCAEAGFWISAIAVTSKGFAARPEPCAVMEAFSRATQVSLAAVDALGDSADVRSKAVMLLHRMVDTLGEELLSFLNNALPQLLERGDARELSELVTLINQLVLTFRASVLAPVTLLFSSVATATFRHLQALDGSIATSSSAIACVTAPASDDVRERRTLLRCFFLLVHSLVHSELTEVLAAPMNSSLTAPLLRLLLTGCVEGPDLQLQRQCFAVVQRLVEAWVGQLPHFDCYVLTEVLPVCFSAPAQPHFNLKDAAALPLLEASATLQKAILAKLGDTLVAHMRDGLLPSLGCSAALCNEYTRFLCDGDARQLRDFIQQLVAAQ